MLAEGPRLSRIALSLSPLADRIVVRSEGDRNSRCLGGLEAVHDRDPAFDYLETRHGELSLERSEAVSLTRLLERTEDKKILGVHLIGQSSSELVHMGMMLVHLDATLDQLLGAVFNYPTLSEAYRVAALDGINRL